MEQRKEPKSNKNINGYTEEEYFGEKQQVPILITPAIVPH